MAVRCRRESKHNAMSEPARFEAFPLAVLLVEPHPKCASLRMEQTSGVKDQRADTPRRKSRGNLHGERLITIPILDRVSIVPPNLPLRGADKFVTLDRFAEPYVARPGKVSDSNDDSSRHEESFTAVGHQPHLTHWPKQLKDQDIRTTFSHQAVKDFAPGEQGSLSSEHSFASLPTRHSTAPIETPAASQSPTTSRLAIPASAWRRAVPWPRPVPPRLVSG
jgi:hypothetical protein